MRNIHVQLIIKPEFDVFATIGGLASLTQHKRVFKPTSPEAGEQITKRLIDMGHTSLLECADFGFVFGSTSRVFLAQITRHRVASYTSGSQQYQEHDGFPYVVPDSILSNPTAELEYHRIMKEIDGSYGLLKSLVGKDDARYVLPGGASNHLFAKFNLREILCVIMPQRLCRRNTPECLYNVRCMLRAMANAGFERHVALGGPSCVTTGRCDQGRMSCGRPFKGWHDAIYDSETTGETGD